MSESRKTALPAGMERPAVVLSAGGGVSWRSRGAVKIRINPEIASEMFVIL